MPNKILVGVLLTVSAAAFGESYMYCVSASNPQRSNLAGVFNAALEKGSVEVLVGPFIKKISPKKVSGLQIFQDNARNPEWHACALVEE
jgi:hypothetical protein